jgi:hypothetical protein
VHDESDSSMYDDDDYDEEEDETEMEVPEEDYRVGGAEESEAQEPEDSADVDAAGAEVRDKTDAKGSNIIAIPFEGHAGVLMEGLQALQKEGKLTDVNLVCADGAKVPCHRAVLAAASPALRAAVEGLKGAAPALPVAGVDAATAGLLLDYLYAGTESCPFFVLDK